MIPQAAITQWRNTVPWRSMHQVEQDLILSRALVAIYSDALLAASLAFRGGTALHKLYLSPQARYSEDLDFVQVAPVPIGPVLDRLRKVLAFLGEPKTKRKTNNNVMLLSFETTSPPVIELRIKIEINCKEHFTVLDRVLIPFIVDNLWFNGECDILTYQLEELVGTKLRALYQRRKGRDLFDLAHACDVADFDITEVAECYKRYIAFPDNHLPTAHEYAANLEAKLADPVFRADVEPLLRAEIEYDIDAAFQTVADAFIPLM
ncbi:MAG: nucleotidyl transferase AbiEii/AbiGii toxin family protein [Coriobacteriia bacterium]|nr:nucleotidyl transferase AbiEii/AbiGii toxin family protein [Coriobacteriia bacterium]